MPRSVKLAIGVWFGLLAAAPIAAFAQQATPPLTQQPAQTEQNSSASSEVFENPSEAGPTTADGRIVPREAETLWIGLPVIDGDGQEIGKVAGLFRDEQGIVREVNAETGGFWGFFTESRAIPIERVVPDSDKLVVPMTWQEIAALPPPRTAYGR